MLVWEFSFISIFESVIWSCIVLGFGHSPFIVISYIYRQVRAGLALAAESIVYMQVKQVYIQLSSSC